MTLLSKEKTLGRISPDQLGRTLALFDQMESWGDLFRLLRQSPRFIRLVSNRRIQFRWADGYELSYLEMCVALVLLVANPEELTGLSSAKDKHEFLLRQAEGESDEAIIPRVRARKALMVFGLLMCLIKSTECMSLYSVPMNELVRRARTGDREALLRAVRIDPSVLASPSIAHQLSLAVMRREKKFLQRIKKAFDGPYRGLYPYKKLRISALILEESGALSPKNREHVFEVVAHQLKLYEQSKGDPYKGLYTAFARWKAHATT